MNAAGILPRSTSIRRKSIGIQLGCCGVDAEVHRVSSPTIHDRKTAGLETEVSAGHAIDAGIKAGLRVDSTIVSNSPYLDIGTPDGLRMALQRSAELL